VIQAFSIGISWVLIAMLAITIGLPIARWLGAKGPTALQIALWTGLALLTALVVLLGLVVPLRGSVPLTVMILVPVGVGAMTLIRFRIGWLKSGWNLPLPKLITGVLIAVVAILAIGATLAATHYDFALYHYSGLSWASQYPTTPGLANLIDYLGYANSATPWSAMLLNGPAGDRGYAAFAGIWAFALILDALLRLSGKGASKSPGTYIAGTNIMVLLSPLLIFADLYVASPTSDTAVFALTLVSVAALADGVVRRRSLPEALPLTLVPLLIATSMRPQIMLITGLSSLVLLLVSLRNRHRLNRPEMVRSVVLVSSLGIVLGLAAALRDYRLSGWLVYPLSIFGFDVPWRVEEASTLRAITIGIARDPGPGYQNAAEGYAWLVPWISRQFTSWEAWAGIALLAVAALLAGVARFHGRRLRFRGLLLTVLPLVAFTAAWVFVLPPTWRHSWGAVFGLGSASIGWFAWRFGFTPRRWVLIASFVALGVALVALFFRYPTKPTALEPIPANVVVTESGLELLLPTGGDRCGIAPLLCTPMPRADLRLLGEDLGDGFTRQAP